MDSVGTFEGVEYAVYGVVLALSAAIGVFYGCFGSKQNSTEEYLLANRSMSPFPVALSLMCTFISAIAILGNTTEIYLYGTQFGLTVFSFIPLSICLAYLYVPVYFKLQVSSAYEYLELRFNKETRIFVSLLAILHLTIYMAIVVLGPSLALEQVTGINTRLSTAAIFLVSIFYSSIGGLKAVLWTDALQAVIMVGSMIVVMIKGIYEIGGIGVVWEKAVENNRVEFFNFDVDPRARHTVWTAIVGGCFMWLPNYAATQAQVQRYLSLPTLKACRQALFINMLGQMLILVLCFLAGIAIYARYYTCDPVISGVVSSPDQLLPLFVMDTSQTLPGIPGLFVAGLTCASLSSVSTGLNALSSIVTFDYIKKLYPNWSDERLSNLSKILSLVFGAISFGFVFVAEQMGNILPPKLDMGHFGSSQTVYCLEATLSLVGMIVGPTLGIFTLGMFFPWSNAKGAICGMCTTLVIMACLVVGSFLANQDHLLPDQRLPRSVAGCSADNTTDIFNFTTTTPASSHYHSINVDMEDASRSIGPDWKNNGDSGLIQILSIATTWFPGLGCLLTIIFGLTYSLIFSAISGSGSGRKGSFGDKNMLISSKLFSPPVLSLWQKICPANVAKYVRDDEGEDLITVQVTNDESEKNKKDGDAPQLCGLYPEPELTKIVNEHENREWKTIWDLKTSENNSNSKQKQKTKSKN